MRSAAIIAAVVAVLAVAGAAHALAVTIELDVHAGATVPFDEPAFSTSCSLTVPDGANGSQVLDAAAATGCIDGWDSTDADGTFLTQITGPGQTQATDGRNTFDVSFGCQDPDAPKTWSWWTLLVDGEPAPYGLDGYAAQPGDVVELHYLTDDCTFARTMAFFQTGGTHLHPPTPVAGNDLTDPGRT